MLSCHPREMKVLPPKIVLVRVNITYSLQLWKLLVGKWSHYLVSTYVLTILLTTKLCMFSYFFRRLWWSRVTFWDPMTPIKIPKWFHQNLVKFHTMHLQLPLSHECAGTDGHHWFREWLVVCFAPIHFAPTFCQKLWRHYHKWFSAE